MSEALKALNNIRTLRAQTREVSLEYLEDILENSRSSLKNAAKKKPLSVRNSRINRQNSKPFA
jgi:DNA-binding protein H-NS